ncbi:hypothetical protein [Flavobacterium kingsejongi]|uniref:Uncharacterized protein n=1 Tax=Flavobacterium kingsejongi TaxID=1678728 RepID=A0A2S1LRG0_9FLAO|nr:hypothetical protein [Flavobacterium kingsejongi]AWG26278.1 hypothetical protein FK004_14085 [Flavobacterium kingsejongi]
MNFSKILVAGIAAASMAAVLGYIILKKEATKEDAHDYSNGYSDEDEDLYTKNTTDNWLSDLKFEDWYGDESEHLFI